MSQFRNVEHYGSISDGYLFTLESGGIGGCSLGVLVELFFLAETLFGLAFSKRSAQMIDLVCRSILETRGLPNPMTPVYIFGCQ